MQEKVWWRQTAIGQVGVAVADECVTRVFLPTMREQARGCLRRRSELAEQTLDQIVAYLDGESKKILAPIALGGTDWQQQVWAVIRAIPYGATWTYAQVAAKIGKPGAARAVGRACRENKLPLIIPCHRVVAMEELGGFVGGTECKKLLLDLEQGKQLALDAPAGNC